jgi:hypothetical protein
MRISLFLFAIHIVTVTSINIEFYLHYGGNEEVSNKASLSYLAKKNVTTLKFENRKLFAVGYSTARVKSLGIRLPILDVQPRECSLMHHWGLCRRGNSTCGGGKQPQCA